MTMATGVPLSLPVGSSPCRCDLTQSEVRRVVVTGGQESAAQAAALDTKIAAAWSRHSRRVELLRATLPPCCRGHDFDLSHD